MGTSLHLPQHLNVRVISSDCYYKGLPEKCDPAEYDFDDPAALDFALLKKHLAQMESGEGVS